MDTLSSELTIFESYEAKRLLVVDVSDTFARRVGKRGTTAPVRGPMRLLVTARQDKKETRDFEPPLDLKVRVTPSGAIISSGYAKVSTGWRRLEGLFRIRIDGDFYQPLNIEDPVRLPEPERPIFAELQPNDRYPFPPPRPQGSGPILVRGEVLAPDGTGIPDTTVTAEPPRGVPAEGFANTYRTNATGRWVLWLTPSEDMFTKGRNGETMAETTVQIVFRRQKETPAKVPVTIRRDRINTFPQTALRGRVVAPGGMPVADAQIKISNVKSKVFSGATGRWAYYYPLGTLKKSQSAKVFAKHPDGRASPEATIIIEPGETTVAPDLRFSKPAVGGA